MQQIPITTNPSAKNNIDPKTQPPKIKRARTKRTEYPDIKIKAIANISTK